MTIAKKPTHFDLYTRRQDADYGPLHPAQKGVPIAEVPALAAALKAQGKRAFAKYAGAGALAPAREV